MDRDRPISDVGLRVLIVDVDETYEVAGRARRFVEDGRTEGLDKESLGNILEKLRRGQALSDSGETETGSTQVPSYLEAIRQVEASLDA